MNRERALKCVLVLAGLLFLATAYPLADSLWHWRRADEIVPMFLSLYVTLGLFLLIAARNPSAHRSVIAFAAWSSFAHAAVMIIQAIENPAAWVDLLGMSAILLLIGVPLLALSPAKAVPEIAPAATAQRA